MYKNGVDVLPCSACASRARIVPCDAYTMTETGELCAARFIYVYTCMYTSEDDLPVKHCGGKRAGCVAGSLIVSVESISCALSYIFNDY